MSQPNNEDGTESTVFRFNEDGSPEQAQARDLEALLLEWAQGQDKTGQCGDRRGQGRCSAFNDTELSKSARTEQVRWSDGSWEPTIIVRNAKQEGGGPATE